MVERNKVKAFKQLPSASDVESDKFINDYFSFKQEEIDLSERYIIEFKKILPTAKVGKLVTLVQEFKMQLLRKVKEGKR